MTDEIERLRERATKLERDLSEAREQASMACEDPADDCTCGGCSYARRTYEAEARTERVSP